MKSKVVAITLLASSAITGYSNTLFAGAEDCVNAGSTPYTAGGTVTTENVSPTLQMGNIHLTLSEPNGTAFDKTGSLVGNITGAESTYVTLLSHTASFSQGKGNVFVTSGDQAQVMGVRLFDDSGNLLLDTDGDPCSFLIRESITKIVQGTGFFNNVTEVEIVADGYVSNCPSENKNYFDISGHLCVE